MPSWVHKGGQQRKTAIPKMFVIKFTEFTLFLGETLIRVRS